MAENSFGFPEDEWKRLMEISGPDAVGKLILDDLDEFEASAPSNRWNDAEVMLRWVIKHRSRDEPSDG